MVAREQVELEEVEKTTAVERSSVHRAASKRSLRTGSSLEGAPFAATRVQKSVIVVRPVPRSNRAAGVWYGAPHERIEWCHRRG